MHEPARDDRRESDAEKPARGREALDEALGDVYQDLRALARHHMANERRDHTLEATAIVHEVYLKLLDHRKAVWSNRTEFFAIASWMIRRILVDHARHARAAKRGGGWQRLTVAEAQSLVPEREVDLLELDEAMSRLATIDDRLASVVELRFFGGLSLEEAATMMDVSPRTAKRLWASAKAWLYRELEPGAGRSWDEGDDAGA